MQNETVEKLISKLDLKDYIDNFKSYLFRQKPLFIEGDIKIHYRFINELSNYDLPQIDTIKDLNGQISTLQKFGILRIYEIFEFIKMIRYIKNIRKRLEDCEVKEWLYKVVIPDEIDEIDDMFDKKGELIAQKDDRLLSLKKSLEQKKDELRSKFNKILSSSKLQPYIVERQIYYINEQESLLVRGGFNHVLKATVVARSGSGFFYVIPENINELKKQEAKIISDYEEIVYEYAKKFSKTFNKYVKFLNFINKTFDRLDHYQARARILKERDLSIVLPKRSSEIILKDFSHPALKDPVAISLEFDKNVLMVTGVNAGGKTMLLKSILSSVFMAKYLLPMKIDQNGSSIGSFKHIEAIIDDPQNVKNDISTFAGRMLLFSKIFHKRSLLVGIDEIELGTDADEAASLYKVILERLIENDAKVVVTTHHKRLSSMMASNKKVSLCAALYDEINQKPTYRFLQGTIGKSYAFETALRYGIQANIIEEAKVVYGEDKERLNELIEKNIELELELQGRINKAKEKEKRLQSELQKTKQLQIELKEKFLGKVNELESQYQKAVDEAKKAAKSKEIQEIHRALNKANQHKKSINIPKDISKEKIEIGSRVKYQNSKGEVLSISDNIAYIDINGIKLRVSKDKLTLLPTQKKLPKVKKNKIVSFDRPKKASVKLDLHGLRVEEALEELDKFISDALLAGFDEVFIYHGIGTGKLSKATKEFLKEHPRVISFEDAPPNLGGFGAKIVKL